ncbi:MAG: SGNH/GDSL hydrolase family protein [Candidatus Dojkabacteria bacterium]|nr:SGNH/GDSL hydrolase family protein [Candidatus Dojkabacteria bacterium]
MKIKTSYFIIGAIILLAVSTFLVIVLLITLNKTNTQSFDFAQDKQQTSTSTEKTSTQLNSKTGNKKLIFIHHSTGENWLADDNGGLGKALMDEGYFVSDTNYSWGPDAVGDTTDIGHWWLWFRGPDSSTYLGALYHESEQNSSYSRLDKDSGGENEIIMFKSCFPNSALKGNPKDPILNIENNLLRGESADSKYHTVANAKGIYNDLLEYFETKQDKLFIVVTAPPLSDPTYASNARAFNNWLVNDWLDNYDYDNVAVFDFYSILTGGKNNNTLAYPSDDDHPSREGNKLATTAFLSFLNSAYENWVQS